MGRPANDSVNCSINNIYQLEGRVPIGKAIPFGLQHILAMFVSNLAPITIIAGAAQPALSQAQVAILLQNAMFVAGIATLIQLYPIWRIGSKLPVVMGVSFTFVTVLSTVAANYGYPAVIGAVLVGGIFEGTLGLLAKYWRKIITPVVAASVVTAIGFSLFTVGARSFGGGYAEDFGSVENLAIGTITLVTCLLWNIFAKGYLKQLSVLAGLVVGYVISIFAGKVDLSLIMSGGLISLPHLLPFAPEFHPGAILSACIIFLVSAAETIGDTSALVSGGLNREITGKEISGSLACDGYASAISGLFERRSGSYDSCCQPLYHYDRRCLHDPCRSASSCRKLFCISAGMRSGRMYHYDVWFYPYLRRADDCKMRLLAAQCNHYFSFPGNRYRIYYRQ